MGFYLVVVCRNCTLKQLKDLTKKKKWRNCGELGKGGSGVVHKQIEVTTGRYRAVKTIDKKKAPDYSRELHVMTILEEVCLIPEGIYPILFLLWECLLV